MSRRLACMVVDDPSVVPVGTEPIFDGDRAVGYGTSAGYGATVGESEPRFDPEGARLRELAGATAR